MAEYISCRSCDSKGCTGCNMLTLEWMLDHGKFDCLMDEHHTIIPTADVVEVKRGRWIRYPHGSGIYCSECIHKRRYKDANDNFCPNCGADMREVTE